MIKIGYAVRRSVLLDISCINTGRTSKDGSCYAIIYADWQIVNIFFMIIDSD